jgi:2-phosphosulfolactate phosphatase
MVGSEMTLQHHTVVVIDVLRATSTIVAAMMAGAREVVPAGSAEEAVKIAQRLGTDRTLLGGERGSVKISGFQLGNSPLEYTADRVAGKTIVMSTTNGTPALLKARLADRTICGGLVNAGAVARRILELAPKNVTIICAGTHNNFSFEDCLAAGAVIAELQSIDFRTTFLHDSARAARILFDNERLHLLDALRSSDHGATLLALGMNDDLQFCSQLNIENAVVPEFIGSTIRLAEHEMQAAVNYDS